MICKDRNPQEVAYRICSIKLVAAYAYCFVSICSAVATAANPSVTTKTSYTLYTYNSGIATFTPSLDLDANVLIVGGGGGGGDSTVCEGGGGGGAGSVGSGVLKLKKGVLFLNTRIFLFAMTDSYEFIYNNRLFYSSHT